MPASQSEDTRMQVIKHDCGLIMEAIRRLVEGTWQLQAEDQSYSWELFPKIRESLIEHVGFEEAVIFPLLPVQEVASHRAHHGRMLALLWSAEKALTEMKAEFFQQLLWVLHSTLHEHHREFTIALKSDDASCSSCPAEESILLRAHANAL